MYSRKVIVNHYRRLEVPSMAWIRHHRQSDLYSAVYVSEEGTRLIATATVDDGPPGPLVYMSFPTVSESRRLVSELPDQFCDLTTHATLDLSGIWHLHDTKEHHRFLGVSASSILDSALCGLADLYDLPYDRCASMSPKITRDDLKAATDAPGAVSKPVPSPQPPEHEPDVLGDWDLL